MSADETESSQHPQQRLLERRRAAEAGGAQKYHAQLAQQRKLFVRERLAYLLDAGSFVEDGLLARSLDDLPADAVVTGYGNIDGRPVAVIANDITVKAGTWGRKTYQKITYTQRKADELAIPLIYLVDSAGARLDEQQYCYAGHDAMGNIFYNQIQVSGRIPQICVLFGPSPAGSAYVPALCDLCIMVDKNVSAYLGSPRMAEMVIGEHTTLEEMGGARMHASVSGCGDNLAADDTEAIEMARIWLSYFPTSWRDAPPVAPTAKPQTSLTASMVPSSPAEGYDIHRVIEALVDADSFFEVKPLWAPELVIGLARLDGYPVGVVANNPAVKGGVLFVDSADKAARFIWCCDAFNIPLIFLCDVPGFMIGSQVERQGIIRHGAKMVTAVSEATVPKVSVIIRKAYGAGLYAMAGPAFEPDSCIALPSAQIAVMGPEAAVNAVYANKIAAISNPAERDEYIADRRQEYEEDVNLLRLASDLVIDAVVQPEALRDELVRRLQLAGGKDRTFTERHHGVPPV